VYFTEENLGRAIRNLIQALREGGRLAVVQNSGGEKATVFRLSDGNMTPEHRINGGTDIDALVLASTRDSRPQRAAST
jgi:ABC-type dipeptide/oligopeptide/nickel transport system ATPase subunit